MDEREDRSRCLWALLRPVKVDLRQLLVVVLDIHLHRCGRRCGRLALPLEHVTVVWDHLLARQAVADPRAGRVLV